MVTTRFSTPKAKAAKTITTPKKRSPSRKKPESDGRKIEIVSRNPFTLRFLRGSEKELVISADDPGIALNIYMDNLQRGLLAVNTANPPLTLPAWMIGAAYHIAMDAFINSVLQHGAAATNGGIVDNFCISPNTASECVSVGCRINELNTDPFVIAVANAAGGHLAKIYNFHERRVVQNPTAVNILRPIALLPPNIQAFD